MNITADEVLTYKHKRIFMQYNGASPLNPVLFQGVNAQYMMIEGASSPESGGIDPVWVQDNRIGKYRLIGRLASPPDLPSATMVFMEKHGGIPKQLLQHCPFNVYEVSGKCADLTDFKNGWEDYILIYERAEVTSKDYGQRTSWDSDEANRNTIETSLQAIYPIGSLNFGEVAASNIDREVADVVFGSNNNNCLGCNAGDEYIYAVTKASGSGSPGLPAEIIYSLDGGGSWIQSNITGFGATEEAFAIGIVSNYLVVLGEDAYYYAEIDKNTGVPGTFAKVTTGIVAAGSPKDMYISDAANIFFVGEGGYIYKSTNITAGVSVLNAGSATSQLLNRVHGYEDWVVAVGDAGAIVLSKNLGKTWALITPPDSSDYLSVSVLSNSRIWVGGETNAKIYFTKDGGSNWTQVSIGLTTADIEDILFVTESVGYLAVESSGVGYIYATWDGGYNWVKNSPRISNLPTFDRPNRLAAPKSDDPGVVSNTLAVAGLAGDATDGVLYLGIATKI